MASCSFLFAIVIISSLRAILHYRCTAPRIHFCGLRAQLILGYNCRHIDSSSFIDASRCIDELAVEALGPCLLCGMRRWSCLVVGICLSRCRWLLLRNFRLSLSPNRQRRRAYLAQFEFLARQFQAAQMRFVSLSFKVDVLNYHQNFCDLSHFFLQNYPLCFHESFDSSNSKNLCFQSYSYFDIHLLSYSSACYNTDYSYSNSTSSSWWWRQEL